MKHSEGFTLIEVMIGILVFTIGILGVVTMQTTSIAANAKAQHISVGSALGSSTLAMFRPVDYSSLTLIGGQPELLKDSVTDTVATYKFGFGVNLLDGGDDPLDGEAALISVSVAWEDYGQSHETTFYYFRQDEFR